MSLAATDAADRVEQLIALTEQLTRRLKIESEAFESKRLADFAAGQEETGRLANLYRRESARVKAEPSLVAGAPAARRARLAELTSKFEAALARHAVALEAAKSLTEGLVQAVATEVAASRARGAGYGPGAKAAGGDARAVTLNKRA